MKIKAMEKLCDKFGGYYEYCYSKNERYLLITWYTEKHALFPDEMAYIKRYLNRNNIELQYISHKYNGIGYELLIK